MRLCAAFTILVVACTVLRGAQSPDPVIDAYVQAVGGLAAIERLETREIRAHRGHDKVTYLWRKPNKVLLIDEKKRIGYDGGSGWVLSSKKRVSKLSKGEQVPLEMDANPLRYAKLKQLYPEVTAGSPEKIEEREMDVLIAPNDRGATKFYFDRATHLLARIEETGETSAYFKHTTEFDDYQEQDGVKLPFRIIHDSTEPGAKSLKIEISEIKNNVSLKPEIFNRPAATSVVLGGKR